MDSQSPVSSVSVSSSRRPLRELISPRNLNNASLNNTSPRNLQSPRLLKSGASSPTSGTPPFPRTSTGHYGFMPREENDPMADISSSYRSYSVHIPPTPEPYMVQVPPTPDNRPLSKTSQQGPAAPGVAVDLAGGTNGEQEPFTSNTMFTGGFNSITRGHVMDKLTEGGNAPQIRSLSCSIVGCDGKAMRGELGEDLSPCECEFKICRDCYFDAINNGGKCPGCKETYRILDPDGPNAETLPLPAPAPRRLSLLRSNKPSMVKHAADFDHTRWLYETKGTYGYGNALWPKDDAYGGGVPSFKEKSRRPLSRKTSVSAGILSPYRLLVAVRLVALVLFLMWRIKHRNPEAMWLWGLSVVCELWFAFSWVLDQLPKLFPVNRSTDLKVLKDEFEKPTSNNPQGRSDLPGIDVLVSTADADKEPSLVTANTILSILAADYPVEKLCCYLSDDGGSLLTFEALAEAASFARVWVPFCRKHTIEPRNPEAYFLLKGDPTKNKVLGDFVKDRRRVKREYDEFKVRINGLGDSIRRRSDAYNAHEEIRAKRTQLESGADPTQPLNVPKATWMADGTHWPGTWVSADKEHGRGDHAGIIQVMLGPPGPDPVIGSGDENSLIDCTQCDIRLPMLVYVSREKRIGYDHNKKAGAMNALVRTSAIMSNGAFILNLDCDHYVFNSLALREGMCFMMDRGGDRIGYVQFPQRFEGIDPNDRYANHNTVFFDVNMRALDGIQGPVYVGTGCMFRRVALYGFEPPRYKTRGCWTKPRLNRKRNVSVAAVGEDEDDIESQGLLPKTFGNSAAFMATIPTAEFQGRPLSGSGVLLGRPAGTLTAPREPLDAGTVAEAINVISSWYEDKTEWGQTVGWIYGSVTEDVVTGYTMHNKGWKSVYCVTKRDAFRGTAPINLTDRLHQVLRWATGSVEIFFSRNNALFAGPRLKFLQRIAYLNVGIYPFTSVFLLVYCVLPAMSLFTGKFIVQTLNIAFLVYLLVITVTLCLLALLEIKWSGITLDEWWRNEQFWVIGGTSAHLAAVFQGLLKVIAGVDISFTLTSKPATDDDDDFADLYLVKWSALMIPPLTVMMINLIAIMVAVSRTIYSEVPQWSKLLGGVFFSLWVLFHLYPFAKGLMGRRRKTPTIVFVWSGLLSIVISLLWVSISSPPTDRAIGGRFQFP